jgi:hypothetical protein
MRAVWIGCATSAMILGSTVGAGASLETDSDYEAILSPKIEQYYADNAASKSAERVECHVTYQPVFIQAPRDGAIVGVKLVPGMVDC